MWRVGFLVLPFFISCTDYGAAGAAGDYGIQCYPFESTGGTLNTAAGIQCAAGGLKMGLRCISVLPPVFSVPPVDLKWVLDAFLYCRRYSVCRRWTQNGS